MEIVRGPLNGTISALHWLVWRKVHPVRQADALEKQLSEDLVRLAETSPHLLHDIGFRCDAGSSALTREVWRRDGLGIAMVRRIVHSEVHVEALAARQDDAGLVMKPIMSDVSA